MEPADHLEAIRREAAAFADAARRGTDVPVPSCPDWTLGELVVHLGVIYRRVTESVRTQSTGPVWAKPEWAVEPTRPDLVDWFADRAAGLVATLDAAGPAAPAWHWFPGGTVGVLFRRMAHETAEHCWDAENAHGVATPVESELAADGVDEMLTAMIPHVLWRNGPPGGFVPAGERFHVHRTDGPGEWQVTLRLDGVDVRRVHERSDLEMRGPASDLLLFLWNRTPVDALEIDGTPELLARWRQQGSV